MKPQYRYLDAAVLRASAHNGGTVLESLPGWDAGGGQWHEWLTNVWSGSAVRDAIALASPALAGRIDAACAGSRPELGQLRRMGMALARYLVRMRGRATPFGLFAGVATARFGREPAMHWAETHHTRTRPDAAWLADVIARLEARPEVLRFLSVSANNLATVRGQRLLLPSWSADGPTAGSQTEVSIRYLPAVEKIVREAQLSIRVDQLIGKVVAEWPSISAGAAEALVSKLVRCGALITNLRPPATSTDDLRHVLYQLGVVDTAALSAVKPMVDELRRIRRQLCALDAEPWLTSGAARQAAITQMRTLSNVVEQPLMVDLQLGCKVVLPQQVAEEAATAAAVLARLTPYPEGLSSWREYHTRFLDRYGPGAVVPLLLLVDPTSGLGFPGHYHESDQPTSAALTARDERLLSLAQQAAMDGAHEVIINDNLVDAVTAGAASWPSPHLDLCVDVRARSTEALATGSFTVAIRGAGATAVATNGRFLDVVPRADKPRMIDQYGRLPVGVAGATLAQLSFLSADPHSRNVHRAPSTLPAVIQLAEYRDNTDTRFSIQDLAVTADHARMCVVSMSHHRVVEPIVPHAAARRAIPPLARLLFEIPRATNAAISLFDWGIARVLPFRPRVRYGRCILSAARWRISPDRFPGPTASGDEWTASLQELRRSLRLPTTIYVGTADRRLWLNLNDAGDLAVLRDHMNTTPGAVTVMEAPTTDDYGWCGGRAHEIVIPLVSTAPAAPTPAVIGRPGPLPVVGSEDGLLPGSQVLFAKLYGHPESADAILIHHLPELLAGWDDPPVWWFIRYRTPTPHLRLRLRDFRDYGEAATRVGEWATRLRRKGLVGDLTLDTYHPETARYGPGAAMSAAEDLFVADSAAVIAQLATQSRSRDLPMPVLTAVSLVDLTEAVLGSRAMAIRWLVEHRDSSASTTGDRRAFRAAVQYAVRLDAIGPEKSTISESDEISAAWEERRRVAGRYRERLIGTHLTPSSVLGSLLHLHYVRAHGVDRHSEDLTYRLARAVALACLARDSALGATP